VVWGEKRRKNAVEAGERERGAAVEVVARESEVDVSVLYLRNKKEGDSTWFICFFLISTI
jgi:hypothetical protein